MTSPSVDADKREWIEQIAKVVGEVAFGKAKWDEPSQLCYRVANAVAALAAPRVEPVANELVEFFRGEGYGNFGFNGDCEGWTPEHCAVEAMRELIRLKSAPPPQPDTGVREALDLLQLQQRGRAKALRLLDGERKKSDAVTLALAQAYEECGNELRAILAAHPARPDTVREAEKTYDEGITFAIEQLATILGVADNWSIQDGSDDHDQDVCDTIRHCLDQSHYVPRDDSDLLLRARQFISDAGCDEDDSDVNSERDKLLAEIDAALPPDAGDRK